MGNEIDINQAEDHLDGLGDKFMDGLKRLENADIDGAAECFKRVLAVEPRLAEPRIELARILMETQQLKLAESEVREAIKILENGGQWLDLVTEDELTSVAYGILAEVLRVLAESDAVVFGDPDIWRNIVDESHAAFRRARELDPENSHASYWAGGLDVDAGQASSPEDAGQASSPEDEA
jgi:tetratricopeptide (TPR) repeat protein